MAGFEDQLNSILGNQEAMGQIMALARSLSGEEQTPPSETTEEPGCAPPAQPSEPPAPDLSALLGQIDPKMLQAGMDAVRQVQSADSRSAALLDALRPFLKEEKRSRLDRALRMARMVRMARAAMGVLGGEEGERV